MTTAAVFFRTRFSSLTEGLPRAYWYLWAGMLVNRLGTFVVPLMMVYLTTTRHLSLVEAGTVVSLYGLGQLVGTTSGGVLADRLGRRATLLFSLIGSATCLLGVAAAPSTGLLIASVALFGLTGAMYHPSTQAIIADLLEPAHRMKGYAFSYWAVNLGFSLAALVGGLMAEKNFTLLFVLDAGTTLVFATLVWRGVPETKPTTPATEDQQGSVLTPFLDLHFAPFLVLTLLGSFIFMQHLTMLPIDMTSKHLGTSDYGVAIAVNGLIVVLLQPFVSRWVTRGSRATWLAVSSVFLGVGFGATALSSTLLHFAFSVTVWTVAEVIQSPLNSSFVADSAPSHMRGRYQGAFSLTWGLAMMLSPLVGPAITEATSLNTFWALCLGLGLLSAGGYSVVIGRIDRARHRAPLAQAVR